MKKGSKGIKKKLLAVGLATIMCMNIAALDIGRVDVAAATTDESDFKIENGVLKKYYGSDGKVVIPTGVTSIGEHAFSWHSELTEMIIPSGVVSIGNHAFYACNSLKSIELPDTITTIGEAAFGRSDVVG